MKNQLTIEGEDFTVPVRIIETGKGRVGKSYRRMMPDEALPDCDSCPKPELDEDNAEAVHAWNFVQNQRQLDTMGGNDFGLRLEAVVVGIDWLAKHGYVTDPVKTMRRVWIIDAAYCRIQNARAAASRNKKS